MLEICEECKYIDTCEEKKKHPEMVACTEFGGLDKDGNLIED